MKIADLFVDLHLETGDFSRELNAVLGKASRRDITVKVKVDSRVAARNLTTLGKNVNKASSGINTFTGRISVLADTLLALGPAAVGMAALAVPAVTALGTAALVSGGAAGTALIAFQGFGDALSAMSKADLEPTTANIEAMHQALENLSPEAREFAVQVFGMRDELTKLKASAGRDLFPGLSDGLDAASDRLPDVNGLLREFGGALGDIGRNVGESLATDRWDVLFSFLKTNARPTLIDLSDAVGSVAHGVVELLDAFAPLSAGGLDWVADVAEDFDRWATNLDKTEGFQEFTDYVREVGPQVVETVAAIADALIEIGEAAAPLSGPVLQVIESLAKALAALADSPVGPTLIAAAIGMRMFSRASQVAAPAITAISTGITDLYTSPDRAKTAMGQLKGAAKSLAGPAGFVGLAASLSSTNEWANVLGGTLSGALIGSAIPGVGTAIGAAIGGAVGLFGGLIAAQANSKKEMSDWDAEVQKGTADIGVFRDMSEESKKALAASSAETEKNADIVSKALDSNEDGYTSQQEALAAGLAAQNQYYKDTSSKQEDLTAEQKEAISNYENLTVGINDMGHALGVVPLGKTVTDVGQMNKIFQQAVPTLNAIGVSYDDWMTAVDHGDTDQIVADMQEYVATADSWAGKTDTMSSALQGLDSEILTTADSAAALATAIEAIFAPIINAELAGIAFRESLRGINDESIKASAGLMANTAAADANKTAILGSVQASIQDVEARAAQGESARSLMGTMLREQAAIRQRAKDQGLLGKEVDKYVNRVYNVPEMMQTIFEQRGMTKSQAELAALLTRYRRIPMRVVTAVATSGVKLTEGQMRNVASLAGKIPARRLTRITTDGAKLTAEQLQNIADKANLTPEEVAVLAKIDTADFNTKADKAKGKADTLDQAKAQASATLDTSQFDSAMAGANSSLTAFGARSESATITTHHVDVFSTRREAAGGYIRGPGTATSDSIPARLSDGEFVVRTAAVDKYGVGLMNRINSMTFARGGYARGGRNRGDGERERERFGTDVVRDVANGLKKGFDAANITKDLRRVVMRNLKGQAEKNQLDKMDRLVRLTEKIKDSNAAVKTATEKLQTAREEKRGFVEGFAGAARADVSEFGATQGGIKAGLSAKLVKVKEFVTNLKKLGRKKFMPKAFLSQIAQLGPIDGNNAAKQLLALSDADLKAAAGDFTALNEFANQQASVLGSNYYDAGIQSAKATLTKMQKDQKEYNRIFEKAADRFATQLAGRLNINLNPHRRRRGTHDVGGWLDVGTTLATNNTGQREAVLTAWQWTQMERLIRVLEQGGGGGGGAPLIGQAVIRETVDLDRYERQRAFRNRSTRIGG